MLEKMHFLIVDDDEDHAELLKYNLGNYLPEAVVTHLDNGEAALGYLKKEETYSDAETPNIILLDINMPRISGLDILKKIKQDEATKFIPVIMLTTSAAKEDRKVAYENHANSYLVKPVDFEKFQKMVERVCKYWAELNIPPHL